MEAKVPAFGDSDPEDGKASSMDCAENDGRGRSAKVAASLDVETRKGVIRAR